MKLKVSVGTDSDTRDLGVPDALVAAGGVFLLPSSPQPPELSPSAHRTLSRGDMSDISPGAYNLSPGDGTHASSANEHPSMSTPGAGSSRSQRPSRPQSASHLQAIFKPPTPTVTSFGSAVQDGLREPHRTGSVRVSSSSPPRPSVLRSTTEPETPQNGKGKRKADEIERTPPDERKEKEKERHKTTFAPDPRGEQEHICLQTYQPCFYRRAPRV